MEITSKNPRQLRAIEYLLKTQDHASYESHLDGEGLQFYVTAKDEEQALWKTETYSIQCENEGLYNYYKGKGFTLLP